MPVYNEQGVRGPGGDWSGLPRWNAADAGLSFSWSSTTARPTARCRRCTGTARTAGRAAWKSSTARTGATARAASRATASPASAGCPSYSRSTPTASATRSFSSGSGKNARRATWFMAAASSATTAGQRVVVSRVERVFLLTLFGVNCVDANVPYRLMRTAVAGTGVGADSGGFSSWATSRFPCS